MTNKPKISIITINWWAKDYADLLISKIFKNTKNIDNIEVIIVDNSGELTEYEGNITILKPEKNLGHGKGINTALLACKGEYVMILDIDTHMLMKDWDEKILNEFKDEKIKLACAMDGGLLKPARPLCMFFKWSDAVSNSIYFHARNCDSVKFDVGVHAYFRFLTEFGDKCILSLNSKKTEYDDVLGNEYTLNGERFIYHNWYGTRWFNIYGKVSHTKIDNIEYSDYLVKRKNLFNQV